MHWDYLTYFPTYFWHYYIWQIIGAATLIVGGFFMMKFGTKKLGSRGSAPMDPEGKPKTRSFVYPV